MINIPANQVTVENIKHCLGDYQITFKNASGEIFNILFYGNDDNLVDYIKAARLLEEPIYFEKNTNTFQVKNNVWEYYKIGASWYKVK